MKKLAFFNHKGGVGKTTLTINVAHALTDAG
jgi:cellulose biosynthesis protein BcsQ